MTTQQLETVIHWYNNPVFKRFMGVLIVLFFAYAAITGIFFRRNDFSVHFDWGQRFWTEGARAIGADRYLLGRLLFDGLLGLMNYYVARAVVFFAAVAALWRSVVMWKTLASEAWSIPASAVSLFATISVVMLGPYILRDLDDCGLQILLLFFLTKAIWLLRSSDYFASGMWFGIAASYKTAPIICLCFLIWKREWKTVAWAACCLLVLNLCLPALFIGWVAAVDANARVLALATRVASPSTAVVVVEDAEKPQNQSLSSVLSRYLETVPSDHPSYIDHPLFKQFGDLPSSQAAIVSKIVLAMGGFWLAWRWRRPWSEKGGMDRYAVEWAGVMLLIALLSPVCWLQHLVLMFPMMLIVTSSLMLDERTGHWRWATFAVTAFITLFLHQMILGKSLGILLLSYKVHAFAALFGLGLLLTARAFESIPSDQNVLMRL
ncbi:MAG TPA: glycosyltransferase 87 family protein [Nitrospiraceae bacterium]|nr:glycosyltransferase 87 family protein [Nitrospiraceae bacterium]